jgi:hypothetical protein
MTCDESTRQSVLIQNHIYFCACLFHNTRDEILHIGSDAMSYLLFAVGYVGDDNTNKSRTAGTDTTSTTSDFLDLLCSPVPVPVVGTTLTTDHRPFRMYWRAKVTTTLDYP